MNKLKYNCDTFEFVFKVILLYLYLLQKMQLKYFYKILILFDDMSASFLK